MESHEVSPAMRALQEARATGRTPDGEVPLPPDMLRRREEWREYAARVEEMASVVAEPESPASITFTGTKHPLLLAISGFSHIFAEATENPIAILIGLMVISIIAIILILINTPLVIIEWVIKSLYRGFKLAARKAARLFPKRGDSRPSNESRPRQGPYYDWSFPRSPGQVTLIESVTSLSILCIIIMMLGPAVQAAREASRRAQCLNNMKQLALAAHDYATTHGCFPSGSYSGAFFNPPHVGTHPENFSCFVRLLPYGEQSALYDAVNFNLSSSDLANLTVSGTQISILICPSDTQNQSIAMPATRESNGKMPGWSFNQMYPLPPGKWKQAFTSYGGNAGTFTFGFSNEMPPEVLRNYDGVIYNDSSVRLADVTDGTSNTFLFGERSKGQRYILDPAHAVSDNTWSSGRWNDTLFSTLYRINLGKESVGARYTRYSPTAAGSFHPLGANFAFCDGTVRFVKDSINSWPITLNENSSGDAMPDNTTYTTITPAAPYTQTGAYLKIGPNGSERSGVLGVYQFLSTRNGSEIIPVDTY
jgi:prepilin-type processing-associated H-X9-DG protein